MVYINIEKYIKVVHNARHSATSRRRATVLCVCIPLLMATLDMCYHSITIIKHGKAVCITTMPHGLKLVVFWIRTNISFVLPILILIYCNGMIVYSIRRHMNTNTFGAPLKKAQILPVLTVLLFVCCWLPWIGSTIYYRARVTCPDIMYVVLNVCVAIGNVQCIINPCLYICMRHRTPSRTYSIRSTSLSIPRRHDPEDRTGTRLSLFSICHWMRRCI